MVNLNVSDELCPECGAKVRVKLEDIAKGRTLRCTRGHSVKIEDDVGGGARKAQRLLDDLEKSLRGIDKNFKF